MKAADLKPRFVPQKAAALTLTEVLIVIAILAVLAVVFLPVLAKPHRYSSRIDCINILRQVGISFRMWGDDHGDEFPMQVSATNGGAMESALTGDVAAYFRVMSNTLDNPAILICPQDTKHIPATNFETLSNSNISYFVALDAVDLRPQSLLGGDDNLIINGTNVQAGILDVHETDRLGWTIERHEGGGNILLGDGSAQRATREDLTSAARLATNRLAIP